MAEKNREIEEYIIVECGSTNGPKCDSLASRVRLFLKDGYKLYGSPVVDSDGYFYQAMVKYK